MNKGKIVQIIGPVVDIEFPDKLPAIYNALTVEFTSPGAAGKTKLTLEVQQHLGDNWIRAAIHGAGFSHGIRSVREDTRDSDSNFVAIRLDIIKRQHITLHQMLFNVALLGARPEYAIVSILIELNAADQKDRDYLRGIVEPLVAEARNVMVTSQRDAAADLVITLSKGAAKPAARDFNAAAR
jgi:hypothetical protein